MAYPFEDLDDSQFERLVVQCMRKLFGIGVQGFATGPDGGRDARFDGVAERFPSTASPWSGITVGQAKHTIAINAHFSDADFSGEAEEAVLSKEIVRVKKLFDAGAVQNYILFTNRRLGANTNEKICDEISKGTGISADRIWLAGLEYLGDLLHEHPDLLALARIDPVDGPLVVSSAELAEVILAVRDELSATPPREEPSPVKRVSYDEKNRMNAMSDEYAKTLSDRYLGYTRKIDDFLADPANEEAREAYESAVDEFQLSIVAKRADYQSFDDVFNYLLRLLFARDGVLSRNRRLVRAMLFYMYWHCDIGKTPDAATQ